MVQPCCGEVGMFYHPHFIDEKKGYSDSLLQSLWYLKEVLQKDHTNQEMIKTIDYYFNTFKLFLIHAKEGLSLTTRHTRTRIDTWGKSSKGREFQDKRCHQFELGGGERQGQG